jgi:hypothetical protein
MVPTFSLVAVALNPKRTRLAEEAVQLRIGEDLALVVEGGITTPAGKIALHGGTYHQEARHGIAVHPGLPPFSLLRDLYVL